jgi:hypothetical protein
MSRRSEPVKAGDPKRFAGLTQRRRERGLPVGDQNRCTCPLPYGPADDCPFHATHPFWERAPIADAREDER